MGDWGRFVDLRAMATEAPFSTSRDGFATAVGYVSGSPQIGADAAMAPSTMFGYCNATHATRRLKQQLASGSVLLFEMYAMWPATHGRSREHGSSPTLIRNQLESMPPYCEYSR